ncbi:hypothetical protein V6N11_017739 [Hibiscus sabdariffa]|uniref:Phosphoglycolate phosphatase n=1 Tax=Hibiscus sabdariffa TaxID=183260 RepID=A0ABR2TYW1_9ROSI
MARAPIGTLPFTPTPPSTFSRVGSFSSTLKNHSGTAVPMTSGKNVSANSSYAPSPKNEILATGNGPGVIWKGDKLIDGVPETLDMLRSKGIRLVFVTNNSTKSKKQYGKKFETLGLNVSEEEIFG